MSIKVYQLEFEQMLDRKPGLRPDVVCSLNPIPGATYFETREDSIVKYESHKETQQPLRYAERLEALHIACVVSYEWQKLWRGGGTHTVILHDFLELHHRAHYQYEHNA
jgi:hypothetical protein